MAGTSRAKTRFALMPGYDEKSGENPRTLGCFWIRRCKVTGIVRMRARSSPGLAHLLGRIRAQIAEECFDLARQRLGGSRQFAGGGENGGRGRVRRADRIAERVDIDHQRSVALRRQL